MEPFYLSTALRAVRQTSPLVHCITNYVTVNDCANILLGCGASPIMSDEEEDVRDIQAICGGLVLNLGTLNAASIRGMEAAAQVAAEASHPIVLDPVGAGASALRTRTAAKLLDAYPIAVVRGNMSEIKALAGSAASTRGVDVNPHDATTLENLEESIAFVKRFAESSGTIVAVTGAIDIVADSQRAYAIFNGTPMMGRITGAGCMLSCLVGAYAVANPGDLLGATAAAVTAMGCAGEMAQARMQPVDGNGSFRTYLLDAICNLNGEALEAIAKLEER